MNAYAYDRFYGDIITQPEPYDPDEKLVDILIDNDIDYFRLSDGSVMAYIGEDPESVSGLDEDELRERIGA